MNSVPTSVRTVQRLKAISRNAHVVASSAIAASHANKLTGKQNHLGTGTVALPQKIENRLRFKPKLNSKKLKMKHLGRKRPRETFVESVLSPCCT
jgi:hypothetical protein